MTLHVQSFCNLTSSGLGQPALSSHSLRSKVMRECQYSDRREQEATNCPELFARVFSSLLFPSSWHCLPARGPLKESIALPAPTVAPSRLLSVTAPCSPEPLAWRAAALAEQAQSPLCALSACPGGQQSRESLGSAPGQPSLPCRQQSGQSSLSTAHISADLWG